MNRDDRPSDQRKSYRFPVPESQQAAELRVGNRSFAGRLYNASAGGFALWLAENPGLKTGDHAELRTSAGDFEVRVAHVGPLAEAARSAPPVPASPATAAREPETAENEGFRLGLERVSDVRIYGGGKTSACRNTAQPARSATLPAAGLAYAVVVVLMVAVLAAALAVNVNPAGWIRRWTGPGAAPAAPTVACPAARSSTATASTPTGLGAMMPDGEVVPGIAESLRRAGMTPQQTDRLLGAVRQTAGALGEIARQLERRSPAERAEAEALIVEALQREMAAQLTDEQQRWLRRAVESGAGDAPIKAAPRRVEASAGT